MNLTEQKQHFTDLTKRMSKTMLSKGNDYANEDRLSNFKETGVIMHTHPAKVALMLMTVKISRLINLIDQGATPENESLQDNALDLCNYSVLTHACLTEEQY